MGKMICVCDDCGLDIWKAGEYVMLSPDIWKGELGLGWKDNLCIGCVEKRLGRRIRYSSDVAGNFISLRGLSMLLLVRMFGASITKRRPYRLKAGAHPRTRGFGKRKIAEIAKARDAGV
jgi:hypothetical protein